MSDQPRQPETWGHRSDQTPVTASLWLSPVPTLYAGAGIGWYNTRVRHPSGSGLADQSTQKMDKQDKKAAKKAKRDKKKADKQAKRDAKKAEKDANKMDKK